MKTLIFIIIVMLIAICIANLITSYFKKKYPELSREELEKKWLQYTNPNAIFWLFILISGIIFINTFKTNTEKLAEKKQLKEKKIQDSIAYEKIKNDTIFKEKSNYRIPGKDFELTEQEKKEIADYKKETAINESKERKQFETDFRNKLLDNGMDIKVLVYGKENKKIKLTYVLFNDVWFRKFETLGYFDQIHERGFTHIELSDGFDYGKGIKYDE